ncbi:MCE family protein [Nocardioides perillae]|uniref:Virulence factor Mce-like protein n=1 Tax=Nocardioides perillae TaxID=1119534 RepID=A0A7Y9UUU0_9ACTN|nr:MCE family protein [Nocardioides perillae]NYG53700.1 virulence factor Mce-like protein [Nocardioides perillae]
MATPSSVVGSLPRLLVPLVVLALVVAAGLTLIGGDDRKTVTALFPRAISVYEGSDVRVLGVPVGEVVRVTPAGTEVEVEMVYDADVEVPADAQALIVAPSIVGDRYVQLAPAYDGGAVLADDAEIGVEQTGVPVELDQIYASLDDLNVALGPDGANKEGALSDLLVQTAEQFAGQGEAFNQTINDFSDLSATLEDNKEELFGATRQLGQFVETLAENDTTVREFNQSLAQVSTLLADERQELAASLSNLGTALAEVKRFVADNRAVLGRDIKGLRRVTQILVRQRDAVDEILKVAPTALNNLGLTYNPQAGTLDTRSNAGFLFQQLQQDPTLYLCTQLGQVQGAEGVCDALRGALGRNRSAAFGQGGATAPAQDRFDLSLLGLVEASS